MKFSSVVALLAGSAVAQVSTVITDLGNIKTATAALTSAIMSYSGTADLQKLLTASNGVSSAIKAATTAANGVTGTVSDADQAMVLQASEALYPGTVASLDALINAKSKLGATYQAALAQTSQLKTTTDSLISALEAKATGAYATAGKTLGGLIDMAFTQALAGTAPTTQALPAIPSAGASSAASSAAATSVAASTSAAATKSAAMSSAAVATYSAASSAAAVSSPAAATSSASVPTYTGAAAKVAGPVGGAVLLAAAAFAL